MFKNKKKKHYLIFLSLGLLLVLGGCFNSVAKETKNNKLPAILIDKVEDNNKNEENINNDDLSVDNHEVVDEIFTTTNEDWSDEVWPPKELVESFDYTGWKTYVNDELGYSVMYPENWVYYEEKKLSEINGLDYHIYHANISPLNEKIALIKGVNIGVYNKNNFNIIREKNKKMSVLEKKILFMDYKTYHYVYDDIDIQDINFYLINYNQLMQIDTYNHNAMEVKQIISSFEFLD